LSKLKKMENNTLTQNEINKINDMVEKHKQKLTTENKEYLFEFIIELAHMVANDKLWESIARYEPE